jgi:hypothetical protein
MSIYLERVIRRNITLFSDAERAIRALLKRRTVEIVSDFNDQPFGRSKKSLKGKRFTVIDAFPEQGGVTVWLEGLRCGARLWEDAVLVDDSRANPEPK